MKNRPSRCARHGMIPEKWKWCHIQAKFMELCFDWLTTIQDQPIRAKVRQLTREPIRNVRALPQPIINWKVDNT